MTRRQPDRTLDTLGHRILRASELYPDVIAGLREQRTFVNALRASVGGGGGSDISDPTGRTVLALERLNRLEGDITDAVATLGVCVNMLLKSYEAAIGHREPDVDAVQCCETWNEVDPTTGATLRRQCNQWAEYSLRGDGSIYWRDKCSRHRKAEQRAKRGEDAA